MIEFNGFPARMRFTPVPNVVFSSLLPRITDINELKVLLCIFEIVYPKKGNVRFVSKTELLNHAGLVNSIQRSYLEILSGALEALVKKGVLLSLPVEGNEKAESLYFLNNEANQLIIERVRNGEITLPGLKPEMTVPVIQPDQPDIFSVYEQNIGLLTPLIADELREAVKHFPEIWIRDAIREAVSQNRRSWKNIARILEHWSIEGKNDGTYRGNLKKNTDPDKYIRGKYGHMVQR
jgi:DNA replication protein